jgi:N-methylhydantoinase A
LLVLDYIRSEGQEMKTGTQIRIGVDIGGTFTDLVLHRDSAPMFVEKVLTTPRDPSIAMHEGIAKLLTRANLRLSNVDLIVHGTTLVGNAILERRGAKTGMVTTRGFRDVLEIGREFRYELYDLNLDKPTVLVPRAMRREVTERVLSNGDVEVALDEEMVRQIGADFQRESIESVVVCFLNSYVNPSHERRAGEILHEVLGDLDITLSSDMAPVIREYERFSTATANAYVRPLMRRYLHRIDARLREDGFQGRVLLMASNGGVVGVNEAASRPALLTESGPAAGAVAASHVARENNLSKVLSFDMGGTTAKICFIDNAKPTRTNALEVARVHRFKRGSGLPLQIPVIEMIEIGAGGGSIARVDQMGLLKVGPESSGADPGPACYGLGGKLPTVTDADLVLGYLDPDYFLGGEKKLDKKAAVEAIRTIATPLGLTVVEAASGIYDVVNTHMATAARVHAAETGRDSRRYVLTAFGGAGPVHAYGLARALGVSSFLCPFGAGVTSAVGLLIAPPIFERSRSYPVKLDRLNWDEVRDIYAQLSQEAVQIHGEMGGSRRFRLQYMAEMRYVGQGYEIPVRLQARDIRGGNTQAVARVFEREYQRLFGHSVEGPLIEVVSWHLVVLGEEPTGVSWDQLAAAAAARTARTQRGSRPVFFPETKGFLETPVFDRYRLDPGDTIDGPAVVEERESTTVIGPRSSLKVDDELNLMVTIAVEAPVLLGA